MAMNENMAKLLIGSTFEDLGWVPICKLFHCVWLLAGFGNAVANMTLKRTTQAVPGGTD
jgi:hypothetical protein